MKKYLPFIHKSFQKEQSKPITQYNFNFPHGGLILLIMLIAFIILIVYLVYLYHAENSKKRKSKEDKEAIDEALRMLKLRYLHGEISEEEYERLRKELKKNS